MSQIIAETYEIVRRIGAGGGGVVYLGRHLRLDKPVAIKEDRRSVFTNQSALRREVDALKNLSHTYIPQVYDFVIEGDTAYTVMDFIEGESLDKPLARGERFAQAQVVKWSKQLLEAVMYLHSRPPHGILHSDIKPANIMITPQNDICLIDFNIALALGAEGAVRVGMSRGYASPEHYGVDYSSAADTQEASVRTGATTLLDGPAPGYSGRRTYGRGGVLLDVRSDIYSLGATMYHLLTGERPDPDAKKVKPIDDRTVSPALAAIVRKSMDPNPDRRYQTAAEMYGDLRRLHTNDPRSVKHRRHIKVTAAALACTFLIGGAMTFAGLRGMQKAEEAARIAEEDARRREEAARVEAERMEAEERERREREEREKAALAAVTDSEEAYRNGSIPEAIDSALKALEQETSYSPRAQKALTDALGVYDLSAGFKPHLGLELKTEPKKLAASAKRFAVVSDGGVEVYDLATGALAATLEADPSAYSDAVFSDEKTLIYAGREALTAFDTESGKVLWTARPATNICVNGGAVAAVYRDETTAFIYDAATGVLIREARLPGPLQETPENDILLDPENDLFALNGDASLLAVSVKGGGLQVIDLYDPDNGIVIYDGSEFTHFEGGFYGKYLAFSAYGGGKGVFAVIDTEERRQAGGFSSTSPFHVQADGSGIFLSLEDVLVGLDPESGEQTELAYTREDITSFRKSGEYTVVGTEDGTFSVFGPGAESAGSWPGGAGLLAAAGDYVIAAGIDETRVRVLKLEDRSDADIFTYDPSYAHSEARLSGDGKTVMLFSYDTFRIYSIGGETLADVPLPDAERVYDQQYRRDGDESWLEVTWYDGTVRNYSARDGSLIDEKKIDPPDKSLYVEYDTEKFHVEAPLNGSPTVYDRQTGDEIGSLQSDDYLTYIYDCAGYTVAEYMTGEGERYGVLLTDTLEPLARIPDLSDVFPDGTLIFDDDTGTLRRGRVYSIQELKALALQKEEQYA